MLQMRLAVVDGRLHAIGGRDGTIKLKSVEVYDNGAESWNQCLNTMNYERDGFDVGVI